MIAQGGDLVLSAHVIKGSALDNLGKTEESIALFEKALDKFGHHHLLHFNLAVNYNNMGEYDKAESAFTDAIMTNPNHSSSHRGLAILKKEQGERIKSLLSLYYFLLLEPTSDRSEDAYNLLMEQFSANVQTSEEEPSKINIYIDPKASESEFGSTEFILAMSQAAKSLDKEKTAEELFIENTESFFKTLGGLTEEKTKDNLWWIVYIPFFYELAQSEHIEAFCYYISLSSNEKAYEWIEANNEKMEKFGQWLNE